MGLNFHKSITLTKGVRLNVSKSGLGLSVGTKGLRGSVNTSGKSTLTASLPGTGLSYTKSFTLFGKKKSSKSSSEAKKKQEELKKQKEELEKQKADERRENELKVSEAQNYIELIRSVHRECDEPVDWEAPPPFVKGQPGPAEKEHRASGITSGQRLEEAKKADEELFASWQEGYKLGQRVLAGDIDAYLEAISEANPFDDLTGYGSGFEFGTDDPGKMEIEFVVMADEVVPKRKLSLLSSGKLSGKDMPKSEYFDITQDYVCSCAVRLAREIFALLPVKKVVVHAMDKLLNTATGNDEDIDILSVSFDRERFSKANFERIDPSDFVNSFECRMKFAKTTGFKPIERIS